MGFLGPVGDQDPDGRRPGDRGDADGRRRRQRGGRPPEGRGPRPRLPARRVLRPPQCRRRRPLPRCGDRDGEPGRARDRPRLQARHQVLQGDGGDLPRREGDRDPASSWAATASASTGSSPRPSRPATTTTGSSGRCSLAPYQVLLIPLQVNNPAVMDRPPRRSRRQLEAAGVDVLIDDRDQRPGVKFKDVDLIGIPLRVVIGERGLKEGTIEVKWRHRAEPPATCRRPRPARRSWPSWPRLAPQPRRDVPGADRRPGRGQAVMKSARPLPRLPYVLLARDDARLVRRAVRHASPSSGAARVALAPRPADRVGRRSALVLSLLADSVRRLRQHPDLVPSGRAATDVVNPRREHP